MEKRVDIDHLMKAFLDKDKDVNFDDWLETMQDPENEVLKDEFERLRKLSDLSVDEKKIWDNVQSRMIIRRRKPVLRYLKYAAVFIIPLCAGWLFWQTLVEKEKQSLTENVMLIPGTAKAYLILSKGERVNLSETVKDTVFMESGTRVQLDSTGRISYVVTVNNNIDETVFNTIVVPRAGEYKLALADGTRVWLNSESELRYPVTFSDTRREVYLKGEGYFEVARDAKRPFRVLVDDMAVRVLGTSFNVNAYHDRNEGILTTLLSGKVDIQDSRGRSLVVMLPDQQADYLAGGVTVKEVDASKSMAWIDGKFYFEEMPLDEIMMQLQRWYDIEVFFAGQDLKSYEFTGMIRRDFTADQIFEIIEKTTQVKFDVKGRSVTINYK